MIFFSKKLTMMLWIMDTVCINFNIYSPLLNMLTWLNMLSVEITKQGYYTRLGEKFYLLLNNNYYFHTVQPKYHPKCFIQSHTSRPLPRSFPYWFGVLLLFLHGGVTINWDLQVYIWYDNWLKTWNIVTSNTEENQSLTMCVIQWKVIKTSSLHWNILVNILFFMFSKTFLARTCYIFWSQTFCTTITLQDSLA